jgi:hypothetical protein
MFEDIRNTGDGHWCASSGVAPSQFSPPASPIHVDDQDEAVDVDNDSEPEKITPTSGKVKRGKGLIASKERNRRQVQVIGFMISWTKLWR